MLRAIVSIANGLHRVRWFILLLALASALVLFSAIAFEDGANRFSRIGLIGLVWSGFALALGHFFAFRDWSRPAATAPFGRQLRWRFRLIMAWIVVACLGLVAVMLGLLSLRAFTI